MLTTLLSLIDESDISEFEKFYMKYRRLMVSVAFEVLKNYHDAEDAVSDAFVSIARRYSYIKSLPDNEQRLYVCQSAKNKAKTIYRKNSGRREKETPLTDDDKFRSIEDEYAVEENASIDDILSAMPETYRDVMFMYFVQEYTVEEIASELGLTQQAVYKRIERGRELLKKARGV